MPAFAYTALSKDGKTTSGRLAAENRAAAIAQMSRDGLSPVKLEEAAEGPKKKAAESADGPVGKVSQKAVEAFTRELANLLAGGVPLSGRWRCFVASLRIQPRKNSGLIFMMMWWVETRWAIRWRNIRRIFPACTLQWCGPVKPAGSWMWC